MACKVEYSCKKHLVGSLVHHNVMINDEKWHLPQNVGTGTGYSEEEVIKKIKDNHCRERDLKLFGFVKDWIWDCD